ncbi:MAG: LysR family transcriptional regulator [Rubellimicrobium sp.]|nr:LysR family transcriptional regulator [Rubellimicrobium sp.]
MGRALDLHHADAVLHLAELRSYRLAAGALATSQPTLTRRVQEAEAALGQPLFRRGWSGVEPTSACELALEHFTEVAAAVAAAQAQLYAPGRGQPRLMRALRMGQLQAVAAVVRTGSVTAAAQALGIGQPELSRLLGRTAGHLGLVLFRRHGAGMQALAPAQELARLHDRLHHQLARVPARLAQDGAGLAGRVAVGMLPFSGQNLIARTFARLGNQHPRLRLTCVPGSYNGLTEALRRREIDCIVGVLRGESVAPDLEETALAQERFTVIARRDHALAGTTGSIAALAGARWVVAPHGTPVRRYFDRLFRQTGRIPPVQTCEMLSFSSAEQMLVESDALGMLTYGEAQLQALRPDLCRVEVTLPRAAVPVGITRLRTAEGEAAVAAFADGMAGVMGDPPG